MYYYCTILVSHILKFFYGLEPNVPDMSTISVEKRHPRIRGRNHWPRF